MYFGSSYSDRLCKEPDCKGKVPFSDKVAGYCTNKVAHYNVAVHQWGRPDCECGATVMEKHSASASTRHLWFCPVSDWESK
jgi:hypothetical protein